jgi:hypothetical protein
MGLNLVKHGPKGFAQHKDCHSFKKLIPMILSKYPTSTCQESWEKLPWVFQKMECSPLKEFHFLK